MVNNLKRIAKGSAFVVALTLVIFGASQMHATAAHAAAGPRPVESCQHFGSFYNARYGAVTPGHDMSIQAILQDAYNSYGDICAQRGVAVVNIYNSGGDGLLNLTYVGGGYTERDYGNVYSSNTYYTYYVVTCGGSVTADFTPFGYGKVTSSVPYTC